jgi:hypothetical protein
MPFIITGIGPDGLRSVTRTSPASAIVLAMRWSEEGVRDIQVAPPGQEARCFRAFQRQRFRALMPPAGPEQDRPHIR